MKKYLLLASILLCFCRLQGQITSSVFTHTFSSGRITAVVSDSMSHDSTRCEVWSFRSGVVTISSSFTGDSLRIVDTANSISYGHYVNATGVSPWNVTVSLSNQGAGDELVPVGGGYWHDEYFPLKITVPSDTLRYIDMQDSLWVLACLYSSVTGKVYIDNNTNCIQDAADSPLNPIPAPSLFENLSSPAVTTSSRQGFGYGGFYYQIRAQLSWMTNYTVFMDPALAFIFPMSPCFAGPYSFTTLPQTNVDFPLLCSSNVDVQCDMLSAGRVRLHSPFFVHPYVSNTGCDTVSGTMTMVKDHRAIYDASLSTHPADIVHGDTLIWNYGGFSNLSAGAYWNSFISDVYLTQDPSVVAGDTLCFHVYANVPTADINPFNNDRTVCVPVVYSYDPNHKDVSPAAGSDGELPHNTSTLYYTINFQNTGTDYAENVKIIDTLDSHLDPHSLKILGASANMNPQWLTTNVVSFDFPYIMLPDSTHDEPKSHGQVQYSINLKPGVPAGTTIHNTGYIYFDENPAVVTNTTSSITSTPSAVAQVATGKELRIYPNPASDELNVENFSGDLVIMDIRGSVIATQHAIHDKTVIDISRLPAGVYMLKATNNEVSQTMKFTKY